MCEAVARASYLMELKRALKIAEDPEANCFLDGSKESIDIAYNNLNKAVYGGGRDENKKSD